LYEKAGEKDQDFCFFMPFTPGFPAGSSSTHKTKRQREIRGVQDVFGLV